MAQLTNYLEEVKDLAIRLVDQIEGVEVFEAKQGDERFARYATPILKQQRNRDAMKRLIEVSIDRIAGSKLAQRLIDPDSVPCAAKLVTWAIKQLLRTLDPKLRVLFNLRLIVQFSSIEQLWIEDGKDERPDLLTA